MSTAHDGQAQGALFLGDIDGLRLAGCDLGLALDGAVLVAVGEDEVHVLQTCK